MDTPNPSQGFLTAMVSILASMAAVVAVRFLLLLAVVGAFVLAYQGQQNPDNLRILTTVIYNLTVVGPLVYLNARRA